MSSRIVVDEDEPEYDLDEPAFDPREVTIRRDKWVADEFEIHGFLGRGKFGEVKRCTEKSTGREFAAKFICAPRPQDKMDVEHELNIMKKLYHKRLIQLYDAFESKAEMCLVLEIIYGGELFDRVISDDFILTEKACVAFMRQICEGLEYMHGNMIIHLDMKPENILCLTRTGNRVKIIDFGLAREYHPKKDLRVLFGTPEFMAPEVVQYETITFGTDMWSVGVICYVLLSGLSPFMGDTDADTLGNVVKAQFDFNYTEFDDVSDDAKDLINKLLVKDKTKRLTASECIRHSWLARPPSSRVSSPNLRMSKKRLKRFVYRRKWQKMANAIIALRRMGFPISVIQRQPLGEIASTEDIFGHDITNPDKAIHFNINADDIQRSLEAKTYDLNKRKASDSGYESVAVDKDQSKDISAEVDGIVAEIEAPSIDEMCISSMSISLDLNAANSATEMDKGSEFVCASPDTLVSEASFTLSLPESPPTVTSEHQMSLSLPGDAESHDKQSRGSSKTPSSRGSSKEPSPCASGGVTPKSDSTPVKKLSIIDRFGGLFLNNKDKEKEATPPKKPTKKSTGKKGKDSKEKEKATGGIVKRDSFKKKMGNKTKQEVYVSTPVVRQKHAHLHTGEGDTLVSAVSITVSGSSDQPGPVSDKKSDVNERKSPAKSKESKATNPGSNFTSSNGNSPKSASAGNNGNGGVSKSNKGNGTKNGKDRSGARNGRNGIKTLGSSVDDEGSSVDGTSVDPDENPRPKSLYGNVRNKMKMFENSRLS